MVIFEFSKSAILIFFCFISVKKAACLYEASFFSALWMVFPESSKRCCPNFYAHDCRFTLLDSKQSYFNFGLSGNKFYEPYEAMVTSKT